MLEALGSLGATLLGADVKARLLALDGFHFMMFVLKCTITYHNSNHIIQIFKQQVKESSRSTSLHKRLRDAVTG